MTIPTTIVNTNIVFDLIEKKTISGTLIVDLYAESIFWSNGLFRVFGIRETESPPSPKYIESLVHPHDLPKFSRGSIESLRDAELPIDTDFRIIREDRTVRWIARQSEVLFDESGRANVIVSVFVDITDRMAATEQSLRGESYKAIFAKALQNVTWTVDAHGNKPDAPLWREMTGQSKEEVSGLGWLDAVHPDDRSSTLGKLQTAFKNRSVYIARYRLRRANGHYRWYLARMAPVFNMDGSLREWLGAGLDVDEMLQIEHPPIGSIVSNISLTITGSHIRAARGALNWSVRDLARATHISPAIIRSLEELATIPGSHEKLNSIIAAFQDAGISFIQQPDGRIGVVLK